MKAVGESMIFPELQKIINAYGTLTQVVHTLIFAIAQDKAVAR
jgi:hypothetical protein